MFRIKNTVLSEEIATAKFFCDVSRCKGACCVVGDAGAPVSADEIPALRKSYRLLENELRPEARKSVEEHGLIQGDEKSGYEISCVEGNECVFVQFDNEGVAVCSIQKAYEENRLDWEKPISCHLYPVRLKRIAGIEYANFEYVPSLCASGCERGASDGVYLSDFLEKALTRRYGPEWYDHFSGACTEIRMTR